MQKQRLVRSALLALPITALLCMLGNQNSMAIAHVGTPLSLLFLPVLPLVLMPGAENLPGWLFNTIAIALEYAAVTWCMHAALRLIDGRKKSEVLHTTFHSAPQPNWSFNADATTGHAFGILMA